MATLFDSASLALIPSGVKDGKLYSIKPTDGSGDFTFSRGTDTATRVNSSGLIEKERSNQLLQSNTFSNAAWTQSNTTLTSGQSGYDGSSDAWKVEATTTATTRLQQTTSIAANTLVTMSSYAKVGNVDFIKFNLATSGTNSIVTFDLTDGTTYSSNAIDEKWESVGGGWVRISATFLNSDAITEPRIEVRSVSNNSSCAAGSFVYIQDAQLEFGLVATTPAIETTTAAVYEGITDNLPRLDYIGGASCPSLLLEPSRTNVVEHSEYLGEYSVSNVSVSYNNATSPEGVQNATLVTGDSGTATKVVNFNPAANGAYTISVFAKYNTHQWIQLGMGGVATYANFDIQNGVVGGTNGTSDIEDYGNGWYRCSVQTTTGTPLSHYIGMVDSSSAARLASSSSTNSFWAYGMQSEIGSYPTSYIPTYGTSASRAVDDMDTTFSSPFTTDGSVTFFIELDEAPRSAANSTGANFAQDFDSTDFITYNHTGAGLHRIRVNANGSAYYIATNIFQDEPVKIAAVATASSVSVYANGELVNTLSIVGDWTTAGAFYTSITDSVGILPVKQYILFPTALTSSEAIALTTI